METNNNLPEDVISQEEVLECISIIDEQLNKLAKRIEYLRKYDLEDCSNFLVSIHMNADKGMMTHLEASVASKGLFLGAGLYNHLLNEPDLIDIFEAVTELYRNEQLNRNKRINNPQYN